MFDVMKPVETYRRQGYLLLEEDTEIELESFDYLKKSFDGYNKVVFTIMMKYFRLPTWSTFILFDMNSTVLKELTKFLQRSNSFFLRTDTYKGLADNLGIPVCPRGEVIKSIRDVKKHYQRFVLILAPPNIEDQDLKSIGNCRAGYVNGEEIQEWTGPGFAEYHLAKDKFPRKATVHAYLRRNSGGIMEVMYNVDRQQFEEDVRQLHFEMGVTKKNIRNLLTDHDVYKKLIGKDFAGKEPVNDEVEEAYRVWLAQESERRNITEQEVVEDFIKAGKEIHDKVEGELPLRTFLNSGEEYWVPPQQYVDAVSRHLEFFKEKCDKIGIDSNEKLLTMTFAKGITSEDVVFWDIHNLL